MSRNASGEGSIRRKTRKRADGKESSYWEGRVTVGHDPKTGKQRQRSVSGKTQGEMLKKLNELKNQINQNRYVAPSNMSVKSFCEIWLAEYTGGIKKSTLQMYDSTIRNHILPAFGDKPLQKLTPYMIQHFVNSIDLSAKSVKNVYGILHKILEKAVALKYISENPANGCELPKVVKTKIRPLEEDEQAAFLKAIQGHMYEPIFKVALFTGMREGEILGLSWDALNGSTLTVRRQLTRDRNDGSHYLSSPKNSKERTIELSPAVLEIFKQQRQKQLAERLRLGPIWTNELNLIFTHEDGSYITGRSIYSAFKRVMEKIGCPAARFHDLRHTYATNAIKSGDDLKTVSENLGHFSSQLTLDIYGHVTDNMRKSSANRMEEYIKRISVQP